MKCWAECLGDCSGRQSNEHYFSANLFSTGKVIAEGFPWLNGKSKEFPISAMTANILCEGHNNRLSTFDAEAGVVWDKINKLNRLQNVRDQYPNTKRWNHVCETGNGRLFERWVAKTAVNMFCVLGQDSKWIDTGMAPLKPSIEIVEAIYGMREFEKPQGLYIRGSVGEKITVGETVGFRGLFDREKRFVGGYVTFKGIDFLLWFGKTSSIILDGIPYRLPSIQFMHVYKNKYRHSHSLKFDWKN